MKFEKRSYATNPDNVTNEVFDCVWVALKPRAGANEEPLSSAVLQRIDWELQGQISRWLTASHGSKSEVTYIPTMRKLRAGYLALQPAGKLDWDAFEKGCQGLAAKQVLLLCEDPEDLPELEKQLRSRKFDQFPENVVLGVDT